MNKVVALAGTEENDSSYIREPFPRLPAQVALIGCRRSGKTTLVANLLTKFWLKPSPFAGGAVSSPFDYVFVFSPTSSQDPLFKYLDEHPLFNSKSEDGEDIKRIAFYQSFGDDERKLLEGLLNRKDNLSVCVFIDDFSTDKKIMTDPSIISLYTRGRHTNITAIINSQYYYSVPTAIRANLSGVIIYRLMSNRELSLIKYELSTPKIHDDLFDEVYDEATKEEHSFLYINLAKQKFYQNFEYELTTEEEKSPPNDSYEYQS